MDQLQYDIFDYIFNLFNFYSLQNLVYSVHEALNLGKR